jgi:signal transduction histidine kinase
MTGEIKNTVKLEHWPKLGIHGYIEKPFTMDQLISEIEDSLGLRDALPLSQWIKTDIRDLSALGDNDTAAGKSASDDSGISEALRPLAKLKPGTVLHVFELHPRSFRARSLGSVSGTVLRWEGLRGKIAKSVIKDTALSTAPILEGNAENNELRHLWTLEMMRYQSFCGLPINVKGKLIALVAFHPDRNVFDLGFVSVARFFAERVARLIERQMLYQTRRAEAELASFGMALAALAHELASDMTALNANLKRLSDIASDNVDGERVEKDDALLTLARIRGNVDVITRKTKILRRTHVRSEKVSLDDCLKKAAKTCRTVIDETIKHPERILVKEVDVPEGVWNVNASEASLIIIFFNLYLNAAQQIELTSSVRRYGLIWNSLARFKDAKGKSWARVRIHDSGPGIHHDDWEQVFDPGYSTKPDGSGLGLYICRYLLKDCLGTIAVTSSAIWDGTVVTVTLPLAE